MKCKNCGIEYEPKRKTSFFCSVKCRVAFNRKLANGVSVTDSVTKVSVTTPKQVTVTTDSHINRWGKDVREMDAETLYAYIGAYENDTWKDSPEFKELSERLKKPLKWLKENKYWIPNRLAFKC